jgi:bifunctional DNA-binding transcriptional regulator/antitoxin component of YhaV-PrlF toxin-antitoxin module
VTAAVKRDPDDDLPPTKTMKVSRKNQVTLPVSALAAAHVKPGDVLRVEVEAEGVFRLVRQEDPFWVAFNELVGSSPEVSAGDLDELRNEWER